MSCVHTVFNKEVCLMPLSRRRLGYLLLCCPAVGEDNIVRVEFVYEPEQQGSATSLTLQRHTTQEAKVKRQISRQDLQTSLNP
jgi:hypothetical protein